MAHAAGILFLNIALFFVWIVFGSGAGMVFMAAASFFTLVISRLSGYSVNIFILSFFATGIISRAYLKRLGAEDRNCSLKSERLEGQANVLADDIKRRGLDIDSLRKKLARYAELKEVAEVLGTTLSGDEISATSFN